MGEEGLTLIELIIASLLMAVLVTSVGVSISVANDRSVTLASSTNAIDQLQTFEETVTRDVHAATTWSTLPSSATTALSSALSAGRISSLPVQALGSSEVVHPGDTIAVGSGLTPTTFVAACPSSGCSPSNQAAGVGATTVYVVPQTVTSSIASGTPVYDTGDVSLSFTGTLSGSSLKSAVSGTVTSLTLGSLAEAVNKGDTLLVGQGSTTEIFVTSAAASAGSNVTIGVNSEALPNGVSLPTGAPVYDVTTGSDSSFSISLTTNSDTSKTLHVSFNGKTTTLSGLDPSSGFFYKSAAWTATQGGSSEGPFYTSVSISLTMDSPSVKAAHPTKTSLSDPDVIAQNIEYACQSAWTNYPGSGTLPC